MPAKRNASDSPEHSTNSWFSFLSMTEAELGGPIAAAVAAGIALILLFTLPKAMPLWLMLSPALAFLAVTLWGWVTSNRRLNALEDYPLSRIASAPQGYALLEGRAAGFPGQPLESPLTQLLCCWYSYSVVEVDDNSRNGSALSREHDTSEWSFMLNDGTGDCVVDPVGARLVPVRMRKWRQENFRYTEQLILPGDPLFVLGKFAAAGATVTEHDIEFQVGQRIADWKKDMPALIKRFDLNGDGQFSSTEWDRVRAQARRDVEDEFARNPPQPQNNVSRPVDGRPFIISARNRRQMVTDMKIWAWIHLVLFLLGITAVVASAFRL